MVCECGSHTGAVRPSGLQHAGAEQRVSPHQCPLPFVERPGLLQNAVRQEGLARIVQASGLGQNGQVVVLNPQGSAQGQAERCYSSRVSIVHPASLPEVVMGKDRRFAGFD